ncbi:TnsA-like heteromeric transposase endonuclease subunit [Cryobacterium breve]|uniref:TnsA-like heteromeric transposase endonuclease subunit n=1 Tax=Cryobacterium breve TaxID=1259258 RepID=A0ABY7N9Z3_9MICO|nr:TnsA-like heteromeric transposase endonuclease subunit [Cryobacterium breve]WBM79119.1 TnsA-like heteromeric transposase endonuclease subunit [Cryobacterium breve]
MKRSNSGQTGPGALTTTTRRDLVVWVDHARRQHVENATPALVHRNIVEARRIRTGYQYKAQRNYHGLYAFGQTGQHIWYESLFEMTALMALDFTAGITAIASQPMMMQFADGTVHYPDLFAIHTDGRQVVYDVRPEKLIKPKTQAQFAETKRLCDKVGWAYELFTRIDPLVKANMEWLIGYRHPRYQPNEATQALVLAAADPGARFRDLVHVADRDSPARGAMTVYNLLWHHLLTFDMTAQLTTYTTITKGH